MSVSRVVNTRTKQETAATDKKAQEMEDRVFRGFDESTSQLKLLAEKCDDISQLLDSVDAERPVPMTIEEEDSVVTEVSQVQVRVRRLKDTEESVP